MPSFSIVLEWETVQEGGLDRAMRGLHELSRQVLELQQEPHTSMEVIVCHEAEDISSEELRTVMNNAAGPQGWSCPVVVSAVPAGTDYYNKKNIGARLSKSDILVFFDTDLLPDRGWLRSVLAPFESWHVAVVCGATHLDHSRAYEMAVALFWIFEPAQTSTTLTTTRSLRSNNLAVRRPVFLRFPFPSRDIYRGQCSELGFQLQDAGILLYEQVNARASHPPPPAGKFLQRAWHAGHNEHFYHALEAKTSLATNWAQVRMDFRRMATRIRERSLVLKPGAVASLAAWLLGSTYYGTKAVSYFFSVQQTRFSKQQAPAHS